MALSPQQQKERIKQTKICASCSKKFHRKLEHSDFIWMRRCVCYNPECLKVYSHRTFQQQHPKDERNLFEHNYDLDDKW